MGEVVMKKIIATLLFVWSAQAGAATVNFEDAFVGESVPLIREGLLFTSDFAGSFVNSVTGTDGLALGCPDGCTFTIETVDSSLFTLDAIDVYVGSSIPGLTFVTVELTGYFSGGASLELTTELDVSYLYDTHTFLPAWSGLEKVEVSANICESCTDLSGFAIDNVTASVVPIPAAVWLFGSALAGLGWMRRKQTA
jgi:hypothetical protein